MSLGLAMQFGFKWFFLASAAFTLTACTPAMTPEQLRSKLAGANVEVAVKSTINEIPFYTRSEEIGRGVMNSGTGLLGAVVGATIAVSGKVDSIPINEGFSAAIAKEIKGKLTRIRPDATESYRLDINDAAVFRTTNGSGTLYALQYAAGLIAVDASDGKVLTSIICSGSSTERLPEETWRVSHDLIQDIRKEAIAKCSNEFTSKLAPAIEVAATQKNKKRNK